jgi:hypothetical protein
MFGFIWVSVVVAGAGVLFEISALTMIGVWGSFVSVMGMTFLIGGAERDYWEHVRRGEIPDPGVDARKSIFQRYS